METRLRLKPGENGAKRLTENTATAWSASGISTMPTPINAIKTVELIEETVPWYPRTSRERHLMQPAHDEPMLIRVDYQERELRERVKQAGGLWLKAERAWQLPYTVAVALGLKDRFLD